MVLWCALVPLLVGIADSAQDPEESIRTAFVSPVEAHWLLEATGVDAHLASVWATVRDESDPIRRECPDGAALRLASNSVDQIDDMPRTAFSGAALMRAAARTLGQTLSAADAAAVRRWLEDRTGRQVRAAEHSVAEFDEAEHEAALLALKSDPKWDAPRREQIRALIRATRIASFIIAVNTEISIAVRLASVCDSTPAILQAADKGSETDRRDAGFHAVFMAMQIVGPTGVAFRPLSDDALRSYLDFARSGTGRRFYVALVASTQAALRTANMRLRVRLESPD